MLQTETITVAHPDSPGEPMIINKSDCDPAIHKPYEPPAPEPQSPEGGASKPDGDQKPEGQGAKSKAKAEK